MGVGKWGVSGLIRSPSVRVSPRWGLSGLSPARAPALCRDGGISKKGGVSNCFVPMLLCQRGLNSSLAVVRQRR